MATEPCIPLIDVASLFGGPSTARADAEIRPLPTQPADSFAPFIYGDYLWARTTQFVEFKGMASMRQLLRGWAA